jgi:elongation factor G
LRLEPKQPGRGNEFEPKIADDTLPQDFVQGVANGVNRFCESSQIVDVKVILFDGAYHQVDSSVATFEIAAQAAMAEGFRKAQKQGV